MNIKILEDNVCSCGKFHTAEIKSVLTGSGVVNNLPEELKKLNTKKVFLLSDINTNLVAGDVVKNILKLSNIPFSEYVFKEKHIMPDEKSVGSAFMHFDKGCDCLITVGSGVLNDISKMVSVVAGIPYVIIATAPSMDGYASDSSSMELDGVKVTLPSKSPDVIIGDTDILKTAPDRMILSGLGDMLAKYISVCEWRISNIVNGEYYCEKVAQLVRESLKKCMSDTESLLKREDEAIKNVFEGLVLSGLAMKYAGVSRPASGVEHYFSHIWDMRALEKNTPSDLHGIQCGIGTVYALKLYEKLLKIVPDKEQAIENVKNFDYEKWCVTLREMLGKAGETLVEQENQEKKYDIDKHKKRLNVIVEQWERIIGIIKEELPSSKEIEALMKNLGMPTKCSDIGIEENMIPVYFKITKDIRNKYILSHLAWDIGVLDFMAESLL
ncbi:MAG: sn-glycerol-1-phosphate dehydrogenase [Clostridia bacterium]|nr:sn-glycerol-1-phosphate dehydrogenase [Clostridia bacterium]